MADFIDAMFGVYSSSSDAPGDSAKNISDSERSVGEELLLEAATDGDTAALANDVEAPKTTLRKKKTPSALLTTLEAGEKVREIQRSNEQWRKARHQVLEEEGVGAIMKDTTKSETGVEVVAKEGEVPPPGLALVTQMRAHQHLLALMEASSGNVDTAPSVATLGLLLANPLAIPTAMQPLAAPAPAPSPPLPRAAAPVGQQIKPATVGTSLPKIALPPAHSFFNLLFPLAPPPLLLNPQAAGGFGAMPWQQPPLALQTARSTRPMVPVRGPVVTDRALHRVCQQIQQHSSACAKSAASATLACGAVG
ncbi:hypothetical protein BBJ28_00004609 [Nothophytophthora sp. Chile5]|nr:hypothetical protein BBJ28_00004609 [Nothophytophthora sp. Chile5]